MKTVAEVDQLIGQAKKTVAKLQADKQKNIALLETARQSRDKNALAALSTNDLKSQDTLAKARSAQRELELLIEDFDSAISAATQQVESLNTAREESFRYERWLEFLKTGETAKDEARALAGTIMGFSGALIEHNKTLRRLTALANESGHTTTVFRLAHFRRFMYAELYKALPNEFGKQDSAYRNERYDTFLEKRLDNIGNRAAEPQQEEAKQTA